MRTTHPAACRHVNYEFVTQVRCPLAIKGSAMIAYVGSNDRELAAALAASRAEALRAERQASTHRNVYHFLPTVALPLTTACARAVLDGAAAGYYGARRKHSPGADFSGCFWHDCSNPTGYVLTNPSDSAWLCHIDDISKHPQVLFDCRCV